MLKIARNWSDSFVARVAFKLTSSALTTLTTSHLYFSTITLITSTFMFLTSFFKGKTVRRQLLERYFGCDSVMNYSKNLMSNMKEAEHKKKDYVSLNFYY